MSGHPARAWLWPALVVALLGCKRDADAPLPRETLFPDAASAQPAPRPSSAGILQRAALLDAVEPDNEPARALVLTGDVVVSGSLAAAPPDASDTPEPKRKRARRRTVTTDTDWFRLTPAEEPGTITRVELRDAPACARLDVFVGGDDPSSLDIRAPLRSARAWRKTGVVVPSLRREPSRSLWVRVRCAVRADQRDGAGGTYRLALTTRPRMPDEEVEPNDEAGDHTEILVLGGSLLGGASAQGALAPLGDLDVYALDLVAAPPGEALLLGVTGVPGVRLRVSLRDAHTERVMLERTSARGEGVLLPNLDVRRTGDRPLLAIEALSGQAPDARYAAQIRTFLPAGCPDVSACPDRLPVEREPNDARTTAFGIASGGLITGLLDHPDDVDWYAVDGAEGDAVIATLQAPASVRGALEIWLDGEAVVAAQASEVGEQLSVAGAVAGGRRLHVAVRAVEGLAPREVYRLRVTRRVEPTLARWSGPAREGGVRGPLPLLAVPGGVLERVSGLLPGETRHGYLVEVPAAAGVWSGRLRFQADGRAGRSVRVVDLSAVAADADGDPATLASVGPTDLAAAAETSLVLPPGRYGVEVSGDGLPSRQLYRLQLIGDRALDDALALALGVTAADDGVVVLPQPASPAQPRPASPAQPQPVPSATATPL